jgi:hypothetical protein
MQDKTFDVLAATKQGMEANPIHRKFDNTIIRSMVRGSYDLQGLRIGMGNRIVANFKAKLGLKQDGMSEKQLAKQEKAILDMLRADYKRITDGVVLEGEEAVYSKIPTEKRFKGGEIISSYAELVLVEGYMNLLKDEETGFKRLEKLLLQVPIYTEFLSNVDGIGTQMAGVIISEIDIHAAEYPSSLHKYAGLDVIKIGVYTDEAGKEHRIPAWQVSEYYAAEGKDPNEPMIMHGKYQVKLVEEGRSRKEHALVNRIYINREKEEAVRKSITFNPFLKTKLIGVMGGSFLKVGTYTVDGKKMGAQRRQELAESLGFKVDKDSDLDKGDQVTSFLLSRGYDVVIERGEYGKIYDDYKNRLEQSPVHKEKTPLHRHNMAIRYMVKMFLNVLYNAWRPLEGLPVAPTYAEAKLHLTHGVMTPEKEAFYNRQKML